MTGPGQLAFDLPVRQRRDRDSFIAAPCNHAALAFVDCWPDWPGPAALLTGPDGSGKSHLLAVWRAKAEAVEVAAQADFLRPGVVAPKALALDDARTVAEANPDFMLHLLNWVRNDRIPLLLTADKPAAAWAVMLPDLASRLRALPGAEIAGPDDTLLGAVIAKQFADRQVRINAKVIDYLVARMERSLEAAGRLVCALDKASLAENRAVSLQLAERVLKSLQRVDEA